ncbi:hypothetical protein M0804_013689 [Polistes exclamans]|nr:hypothetical protein M0804_013689 [Polistes exclamans]
MDGWMDGRTKASRHHWQSPVLLSLLPSSLLTPVHRYCLPDHLDIIPVKRPVSKIVRQTKEEEDSSLSARTSKRAIKRGERGEEVPCGKVNEPLEGFRTSG